jgi:hypothetical protein
MIHVFKCLAARGKLDRKNFPAIRATNYYSQHL